ncbi:MAG: transglutaminase domain-containing protein, partial [Bacteroidota bacterium]
CFQRRWKHNGNNSPSKNDAITILNEAKEGQRFPCFAYAIVLRDQLNALGYRARTVYLKTQDAASRKSSPGHVATEVYLKDLQKWVFVDGQFNVMPFLNGKSLNAVELQDAISHHYGEFELRSASSQTTTKKRYVTFVYDYLYYFDTLFDNRYEKDEWYLVDGKSSLMLVPSEAQNLTHINFWDTDVNYCVYTHSIEDFYAKPY